MNNQSQVSWIDQNNLRTEKMNKFMAFLDSQFSNGLRDKIKFESGMLNRQQMNRILKILIKEEYFILKIRREQFSQYILVNLDLIINPNANTFMQLNRQQSHYQRSKQLLNAPDPEDYLTEKYSSVLQEENEELYVCKMYLHHLFLKNKISQLEGQIIDLKQKITANSIATTPKRPIKDQQKSARQQQNSLQSNQNTNRLKRIRRTANQISRHFQCPVETCKKEYGSQGSLNQHIKLKHELLVRGYDSWALEDGRSEVKFEE